MAQATAVNGKPTRAPRKIKKEGFKRVVVELTTAHHEALEKLATEDLRNGGATEMLTVLERLNLDALIKNHRPAQAPIVFQDKPVDK